MKSSKLKALPHKKWIKSDREQAVLLGFVELYLKTGKPIGSSTLQEHGFESLSSATIRNYFSKMEQEGYLKQHHISGGRTPTEKALRLYADTYWTEGVLDASQEEAIASLFAKKGKKVTGIIHEAASLLSDLSKCAVFISSPRFDQDFIQDVRLVRLDAEQLLAIVITDFGVIRTESLYVERTIDSHFLENCEQYFRFRMSKGEKPLFESEAQVKMATRIYNEVMVRHLVSYANFPNEDLFGTGLSKLLAYPEFSEATLLASSLSLFEDDAEMRKILKQCCNKNEMMLWFGEELSQLTSKAAHCAILAIPYRINQMQVGAIALLGPTRIPYRNLFGLARAFSEYLSEALTQSIYKYKISFRTASKATQEISNSSILLENQGHLNE
ncbi:MAG TPA: heat-inducible transcriptional repressor HrcA [Chlamydiales bacterium]|nr:MAG: heat-inducible transcription repressor HrcA [Verrucomicrobia bacterium RIFCSPHIGHO2_12_FULL_41_10]HLB52966.1 heat-inducible transcriptional repressor HrcA [Chlamydiales bacterium]